MPSRQPMPPALEQVLDVQRIRLDALHDDAARSLLKVIAQARRELQASIASLGMNPDTTFTLYQRQALMVQLDEMAARLSKRLGQALDRNADVAGKRSVRDVGEQLRAGAEQFRMGETAAALPEAARLADRRSKIREVEAERARQGAARYGMELVGDLEKDLSLSLLQGETTFQATQRVLGKGPWIDRLWKAERLARTEFSHAYNATSREVLDDIASQDDGLWVMWHEHAEGPAWAGPKDKPWPGDAKPLDNRVAEDSLRLHGQMRRPGEKFIDPENGKVFDHPPNRPNDRATLVMVRVDEGKGKRGKAGQKAEAGDKDGKQGEPERLGEGSPNEADGGGTRVHMGSPQPRPDASPAEEGPAFRSREDNPHKSTQFDAPAIPPHQGVLPREADPPRSVETLDDLLANIKALAQASKDERLGEKVNEVRFVDLNGDEGNWRPWYKRIELAPWHEAGMRGCAKKARTGEVLNEHEVRALSTSYHEYLHSIGPQTTLTEAPEADRFVKDMAVETYARRTLPDFARGVGLSASQMEARHVAAGSGYSHLVSQFRRLLIESGLNDEAQVALFRDVLQSHPKRATSRVARAIHEQLVQAGSTSANYQQILEKLRTCAYDREDLQGMRRWIRAIRAKPTGSSSAD